MKKSAVLALAIACAACIFSSCYLPLPGEEDERIETSKKITLGEDYDAWRGTPYHVQATVEYLDLREYGDALLTLSIDSDGYEVEVEIHKGKIDKKVGYWESKSFYSISDRAVDPSLGMEIGYPDYYSIVYVAMIEEDEVPENLRIVRRVEFQDSAEYPLDYSEKVVVDLQTFGAEVIGQLNDPYDICSQMNSAYAAMMDLIGEDSRCLNAEGNLRVVARDLSRWRYIGLAGNIIQMNRGHIPVDRINEGDPAWGFLHELGHEFTKYRSYCWDGTEMWANFMAFYLYDVGLFSSEFELAQREYWDRLCATSDLLMDIFMGYCLELKDAYGWVVMKNFFRKYNDWDLAVKVSEEERFVTEKFFRKYSRSDIPLDSSEEEKIALSVRRLAESLYEVTGDMEDYYAVYESLRAKGFDV